MPLQSVELFQRPRGFVNPRSGTAVLDTFVETRFAIYSSRILTQNLLKSRKDLNVRIIFLHLKTIFCAVLSKLRLCHHSTIFLFTTICYFFIVQIVKKNIDQIQLTAFLQIFRNATTYIVLVHVILQICLLCNYL